MNFVTTKQKNKCWFHHSIDILRSLIETRNGILTEYWTFGIVRGDTCFTKQVIQNQKQEFNYSIALPKADWSAYQAERIHSMRFNHREAWDSVKSIYCGEKIHHKNPTIMSIQLPYGNIATTDADNASVLVTHFDQLFFAYCPVDWSALEEVIQRDIM